MNSIPFLLGGDGSRGVKNSASFLVREGKGRSHVHLVAASGHIGVLVWLLHTAQSVWTLPVITDNQGYTPLHWACYNGTYWTEGQRSGPEATNKYTHKHSVA